MRAISNVYQLPHALSATLLLPQTLSACNRIPNRLCTGICHAAILCTVGISTSPPEMWSDCSYYCKGISATAYKVLMLDSGVCTPVNSFSIFDRSLAVDIKNNINSLTLCAFLEDPHQSWLGHLCKGSVVTIHFWTRLIPSMMHFGVGMCSVGDTFFSSSLASAALLVFRKLPSAFASDQGNGPSRWARTSLILTFLLSATRYTRNTHCVCMLNLTYIHNAI